MEERCGCSDCGSGCEAGQCEGAGNEQKKGKEKAAGIEKWPFNEYSSVKNVIAVMIGKGGVGKSSVTSLLACGFRKKGFEVGVMDADITGPSLPRMFGVREIPEQVMFGIVPPESSTGIKVMSINFFVPHEDDPVIWRGPILANAVKQFWTDVVWTDLDYLFVDLPPGTGDVPLSVMQSMPLTGIIIVSSPQDLAVMIVKKAIKMTKLLKVPILGLVENMTSAICPDCGREFALFGPGRGREVAEKSGIEYLGSLPIDPTLSKLCDEGRVEEYRSVLFEEIIPGKLAGTAGEKPGSDGH